MIVPQPIQLRHEGIRIQLPVGDLPAQEGFYRALGFRRNPALSDDGTTAFDLNGSIRLLLLAQGSVPVHGPQKVCHALDVASRRDVDELIRRVRQAGGAITREPGEQGAKYSATFDDLEGYAWEIYWTDPGAA